MVGNDEGFLCASRLHGDGLRALPTSSTVPSWCALFIPHSNGRSWLRFASGVHDDVAVLAARSASLGGILQAVNGGFVR